jgi:N-acetylglucosaminyl-diphospho-decaprenol L-rhamnosyltransferase
MGIATAHLDLSLIVVTHNRREAALATLSSASASLGDISSELLVVDSGSTDGTPDAIEDTFPEACVTRAPNRGFAAGNNIALRQARGRYALLLNPDVLIEQGTFADLVAALDRRPEVGIASVLQQSADGHLLASIRRFPTPARHLGEAVGAARLAALRHLQEPDTEYEEYAHERSVEWLVGAFLCARREAIEQVGLLDESFFLYAEETDWCLRFRQHGWDVRHIPVMTVTHVKGDMSRPKAVAQLELSRRHYAYKHLPWPRAIAAHAGLVLGRVLRLLVMAPGALLVPGLRHRMYAEALALAVLLGAAPPY